MFTSLALALQSSTASAGTTAATKQALLAVVQVWLDRLQAMAVITTFFMSIDTMMYGFATASLPPDQSAWSNADLLKTTSLGGAIILHVCASILAYMASFTLIRYRLEDAEEQVEAAEHPQAANEVQHNLESQQQQQQQQPQNGSSAGNVRKSPPMAFARSAPPEPSQDLRSLVSVYQVKPLRFLVRSPPVRKTSPEAPPNAANDAAVLRTLQSMIKTLTRCHVVVMTMSNVGFLLAVLGTITYFWTSLPVALGTFASVCLGVSFVAGVYAVM